MHKNDLRINTVPVSGLQYSTSPSLPTAVKALGMGRDNTFAHNSTSALTSGSSGLLPQSTLDLYDKFYSSFPGTEPAHHHQLSSKDRNNSEGGGGALQAEWSESFTLPDGLSSIGPSARRLLQLDAAHRKEVGGLPPHTSPAREQGHAVETNGTAPLGGPPAAAAATVSTASTSPFATCSVMRTPLVPAAAHTLPIYAGKMKSTSARHAYNAKKTHSPANTTTFPTTGNVRLGSTQLSPLNRSGQAAQLPFDVRPPLLSSTITNGGLNGGASTVARAVEATAPTLVTQLQTYIQREVIRGTRGGALPPSAMDQLGPYREAFRALCSAFPAYASLLSDIQSAYDNAIQAQAELLTDAYATMTVRNVERNTNQELVTTLRSQVKDLQEELKSMEDALETRMMAEEQEKQKLAHHRPRTAQLSDLIEMRRELEVARQRIGELERNSKGDLEKIVILIGAVRECDRRLKEYERIVAGVTGQVSELDEFKRIAGEAQMELQLFRKKYADYVPVTDFQLMKDYLAAELEAAQMQTRRWRRTAAVRGTQLDVMQHRLSTLEEERANFIAAAEGAVGDSASLSSSSYRALLTPRPSWKKLHADLPELADYAADVGQLTTANDQLDEAALASGPREADSSPRAKSLPTVTGFKETSLQVEYLVQRVRTLEAQLQAQQQRRPLLQPSVRMMPVQTTEEKSPSFRAGSTLGTSSVIAADSNDGKERNITSAKAAASSTSATAASMKAAKTETTLSTRRASRRTIHRFSEGFPTSALAAHTGGLIPAMAPPLELPLVGLGYGPEVPVYLRVSGIVPRNPVPSSTIVSLAYHFFLDILPQYMDQQDQLRSADEDASKDNNSSHGNHNERIGVRLCEYLKTEMTTREDLKEYDSVPHLMMNLIRDGEGSEWFSDALHLLLWTVQGVLPPRVAVDAAVVVAQVRRDLQALGKDMQSARVRRQALSECLQPVLELKSPSEVVELRAALGGETTFSVDTLCSDTHPFMEVLFVQECRDSADLYVTFLSALTARATSMESRAPSANSGMAGGVRSAVAPLSPPLQLEVGDRVVTLADVAAAIEEVEPRTPEIVVRELSVNAVADSCKQDLLKTVPSPGKSPVEDSGTSKSVPPVDTSCIVVRLSDIVRAIGAAPLIRRSPQNTLENCVL